MATHTIALINHKGGVTKTTAAIHLGAALAEHGLRALVVDMDPQAHVSQHLGIQPASIGCPLERVLTDRTGGILDCILTARPNLDVAPCTRALFEARSRIVSRAGADSILARALRPIRNHYDIVVIDSPPDEGVLSINAMFASTHIMVPTILKAGSIDGISRVLKNLDDLKAAHKGTWSILGVLISQLHAGHIGENAEAHDALVRAFGRNRLVLRTAIRVDEAFPRAWREGAHVIENEPRSRGASDFRALALEVMRRLKLSAPPVKLSEARAEAAAR